MYVICDIKDGNALHLSLCVFRIYIEMENACLHVMFQNNYGCIQVQFGGNCKMGQSDVTSYDGGWLSTYVFDNTANTHALKVVCCSVYTFLGILVHDGFS